MPHIKITDPFSSEVLAGERQRSDIKMTWICLLLAAFVAATVQGFILQNDPCFGKYGCFSVAHPFDNTLTFTPQSPDHIGTKFHLYTRQNPTTPQTIMEDNAASVKNSHFNPKNPSKFIIHGYINSGDTQWLLDMKTKFLSKEDANIFTVGWDKGSFNLNYMQAAANTRVVGAVLAELLKTLNARGAAYSSFHLIGHSLGAHIAGYAGEKINKVGRITGLDPAGPAFDGTPAQVRLDPTDATFVDAIHTDAKPLVQLGFGTPMAVGHVDFYPNGGFNQPGCPKDEVGSILTLHLDQLLEVACNHMRAIDLFAASITNTCQLTGHKCASETAYSHGQCNACTSGCAPMGYHDSPASAHGSYYLTTTAHAPFCA